MKTLWFKFNSAKLPVVRKSLTTGKFKTTDVANEFGKKIDGDRICIDADDPIKIDFKTISNVLHVLCGCRPVPSYRKSFMKRIPILDEIANTAYIKYDNDVTYTDKNGNIKYCVEFTEGKKQPWNAHMKGKTYGNDGIAIDGFISWNLLYKRYGIYRKEEYNKMIELFSKTYDDTFDEIQKKFSLLDFLVELSNEKYDKTELFSYIDNIKCKALKDIILSNGDKKVMEAITTNEGNNLAALCINTNPTRKVCLRGEICILFDDENREQMKVLNCILNGKRCATFLDGGLVHDLRCDNYEISDYELLNEGFLKIEK